jgi:hypothetical protein
MITFDGVQSVGCRRVGFVRNHEAALHADGAFCEGLNRARRHRVSALANSDNPRGGREILESGDCLTSGAPGVSRFDSGPEEGSQEFVRVDHPEKTSPRHAAGAIGAFTVFRRADWAVD